MEVKPGPRWKDQRISFGNRRFYLADPSVDHNVDTLWWILE